MHEVNSTGRLLYRDDDKQSGELFMNVRDYDVPTQQVGVDMENVQMVWAVTIN